MCCTILYALLNKTNLNQYSNRCVCCFFPLQGLYSALVLIHVTCVILLFSPDGLTEFRSVLMASLNFCFDETALDVARLCSDRAPCDLIWRRCDQSDAADTPLLLQFFSRLLLGCWWSSLRWGPAKTAHSPRCPMEPQRMFMPAYSKMITTASERCEIGATVLWGRTGTNDVKPDCKVFASEKSCDSSLSRVVGFALLFWWDWYSGHHQKAGLLVKG